MEWKERQEKIEIFRKMETDDIQRKLRASGRCYDSMIDLNFLLVHSITICRRRDILVNDNYIRQSTRMVLPYDMVLPQNRMSYGTIDSRYNIA